VQPALHRSLCDAKHVCDLRHRQIGVEPQDQQLALIRRKFVELSGHHQREIAVPVGRRLGPSPWWAAGQPAGIFRIEVGSSSRVLPLRQSVPVVAAHP